MAKAWLRHGDDEAGVQKETQCRGFVTEVDDMLTLYNHQREARSLITISCMPIL